MTCACRRADDDGGVVALSPERSLGRESDVEALPKGIRNGGVPPADRTYLAQLVAIAGAKEAETKARQAADAARLELSLPWLPQLLAAICATNTPKSKGRKVFIVRH
jgi:hypothetical protein